MADESGVTRDVVLRALRAAGPPYSPCKLYLSESSGEAPGKWFVIVAEENKPGFVEYIAPIVSRQEINRLNRRYKVPKPWFYNPLLIPDTNGPIN